MLHPPTSNHSLPQHPAHIATHLLYTHTEVDSSPEKVGGYFVALGFFLFNSTLCISKRNHVAHPSLPPPQDLPSHSGPRHWQEPCARPAVPGPQRGSDNSISTPSMPHSANLSPRCISTALSSHSPRWSEVLRFTG